MIPDWRRALGGPVCRAALKTTPEDFIVEELLGFSPDGDGEHDLLHVEKIDTNTEWLARQLARHAGVPARDVGFCGLKDRHARTRQWFSVRRPRGGTEWRDFHCDGVNILETAAHRRKLRRGANAGNHFRLRLRGDMIDADAVAQRIGELETLGMPNYFGAQRFGRDGANLELARAVIAGRRMKRQQRAFALSAGRSYLFNRILEQRVIDGSWNRLLSGDIANLDGSNSLFAVDEPDEALHRRCAEGDIHPTGELWGEDSPASQGQVRTLELEAVAGDAELADGLASQRLDSARRALRVNIKKIIYSVDNECINLEFDLPSGAYATSLVRELASA